MNKTEEENNKYDEERINYLRKEAGTLLEEEHSNIINKLNRLEIREEKEETVFRVQDCHWRTGA